MLRSSLLICTLALSATILASCGGGSKAAAPTSPTPTTTVPAAPGVPTLTVDSDTAISLSWTAVTGATSYEVWRHTTNVNSAATKLGGSTAITVTTFADSGLVASTRYHYWLKACNTAGCSAFGSDADKTTDAPTTTVEIPAAPGVPTLTVGSDTAISLSWVAVTGATSYEVWRHTTNVNSAATKLGGNTAITVTTFADSGLAASTRYHYWLKACNTAGCSIFGDDANKTTDAPTTTVEIPAAPGVPTLTVGSDTAISLSWAAVTGATSYEVWRHTTDVNTAATKLGGSTAITVTTFADSGLAASTQYYYWLKACNTAGCSIFGDDANVTTQAAPLTTPNAPAIPVAMVDSHSSISLSWTAVAGAARYDVFRHTMGDNTASEVVKLTDSDDTDTMFVDTGLTPATSYFYWVKACVVADCSDFSQHISATTAAIVAPSAPTIPTATALSHVSISLSWTMVGTATRYDVYRSATDDSTMAVKLATDTVDTDLEFVDLGLTADTQYHYFVQACIDSTCSGFSPSASATTLVAPTAVPLAPIAPMTVADTVKDTALSLSWTVTAAADDYEVYRHTTNDSSMATKISGVTNIAATTYDDTGLTAATTYHYWIKACNGTGCSTNFSDALMVSTAPAPAAGLTAMANSAGTTVTLAWTAATAATRYEVFRNTTGDAATATEIGGGSDIALLTYIDTTSPSTTYHYWVLSCDASNCSSPGTAVSVATTVVVAPMAPAAPTVSAFFSTSNVVKWLPVDTATRYEVWRNTADDSNMATKSTFDNDDTDLTSSDFNLTPNTKYFYWVKACLNDLCSGFSPSVAITTRPALPEMLTLVADSATQITLTWEASSTIGVTYRVLRDSALLDNSDAPSALTYVDTGLSPVTTYTYEILSCLEGRCSTPRTRSASTLPASGAVGAPGAVVLTVDSGTQISVAWGMSSTEGVVYELERRTAEFQTIESNLNVESFTDMSVTDNNPYAYRVRACLVSDSIRNCSEYSTSMQVLTPFNTPMLMNLGSVTLTVGEEYVKSGGSGDQIETEIKFDNISNRKLTACMIVSPPGLPEGLTILGDSQDNACTIVGIPTTPQIATEYNVIATHGSGSSAPATVSITIVAAPGSLIPPSNFAAAATQGSPAIAPRSWTSFADDGGQAQDQEGQDQDPASLEASPPADADADGLIDIATTEQLHNMRYNLAGTSLKTSQSDPGNNAGCPSTGCFGYELINDIDFDLDGDGRTWTGNVVDGYTLDADDTTSLFPTNVTDSTAPAGFAPITGIATFDFEGNGFAIRNMIIRHNGSDVGFVSTRGQSTYRNLSFTNLLVDALATNAEPSSASADTSEVGVSSGQVGASPRRVGGVWASSHAAADIVNTHSIFVTGDIVVRPSSASPQFIGAIAGDTLDTTVSTLWGSFTDVNIHSLSSDPQASVYVGGLIGHGSTTIISSHANGVITAQDGPSIVKR